MDELFPHTPRAQGEPLLTVAGLTGEGDKPCEASLTVREGEIVGIGGLFGSGRSELLRTIYGLRRATAGRIEMQGLPGRDLAHASPAQRLRAGLGLVSEDRKEEGLALTRSLAENIALASMERVARLGWLRPARLKTLASGAAGELGTVYRDIGQNAGDLSGGNQQKIALARLLFSRARAMLLDEPTRGIDVGSKAIIYRWLDGEAAAGKGILLTSSYLPELLGVCDQIGVMYRGRLAALAPRADWTEEKLLLTATTGQWDGGNQS
jgi:ribose transport system ATP-binding protein